MKRTLLLASFLCLVVAALPAQEAVAPPAAPAPEPGASRDPVPSLNIYLPEGEFDIRLRKLLRNTLFEGQVNYNVADGDIQTFLRYKYYARNFTYKIGVFDTIEFASIESRSRDFDRVRGMLLQLDYPQNVHNRYYVLLQNDALSFGDTTRPDNNKENTYLKLGYQYGTPFDERLNSIVGESRGRITPILTAYRAIGPQGVGFGIGATYSSDALGDFNYTKVQAEILKRWDFTDRTFLISRLHAGSVFGMSEVEVDPDVPVDPEAPEVPEYERYTVPRYEFIRPGARGGLLAVDAKVRGSEEIHTTHELFVPMFRNRNYKTGPIRWNTLYAIAYGGAGNVGFERDIFTSTSDYTVEAGGGFEASAMVRDFNVILSVVYAQTVAGPTELEGSELRFTARTVR